MSLNFGTNTNKPAAPFGQPAAEGTPGRGCSLGHFFLLLTKLNAGFFCFFFSLLCNDLEISLFSATSTAFSLGNAAATSTATG